MNQVANKYRPGQTKELLLSIFGENLQRSAPLARYTAARAGGFADWLLVVESVDQLAGAVSRLLELEIPFLLLGGGSNVLVSDLGVRELVILNKAKAVQFDLGHKLPTVVAESGANFGLLARQCAGRSLSGLEWAAGVPGTVGGAVFGNAGAHGGDVSGSLRMAEILHKTRHGILREEWPQEKFEYEYRSSVLKRSASDAVILTAQFRLQPGDADAIQSHMDAFNAYRKETQPPGASMGSIFKNPPDDFAGRLIEAAGLKGTRIGDAEISPAHANFFVNHEGASASDILRLIRLAQKTVLDRFGVELAMEIELVGDWRLENGD